MVSRHGPHSLARERAGDRLRHAQRLADIEGEREQLVCALVVAGEQVCDAQCRREDGELRVRLARRGDLEERSPRASASSWRPTVHSTLQSLLAARIAARVSPTDS